jgi:hypothetical protein
MSLNICLIKFPIINQSVSFMLAASSPLGLAYMAGVLRVNGPHLSVIDSSVESYQRATKILDDLWTGKVYRNDISASMIEVYAYLLSIILYSANYFFGPSKSLKIVGNIIIQKNESNLERVLRKNFLKKFLDNIKF